MKVLDLFCEHEHAFEGWFGSEDDYQSQQQRGLVQCPLCGSRQIRKGLSAPRLNLKGQAAAAEPAGSSGAVADTTARSSSGSSATVTAAGTQLQAAWLKVSREIMARTEDVGSRFADEALRMHHGEIAERAIRGEATPDQARQLMEEGVAVTPLLLPVAAKETLH